MGQANQKNYWHQRIGYSDILWTIPIWNASELYIFIWMFQKHAIKSTIYNKSSTKFISMTYGNNVIKLPCNERDFDIKEENEESFGFRL